MADSSSRKDRVVPKPNNNDDDDEDDLMDVRLPSGMIFVEDDGESSETPKPTKPLQKPEESASIDDGAIVDCWNLTVASHERVDPASGEARNEFQWHAKDISPPPKDNTSSSDILKTWQPKSLPLPPWAVDPFPASTS